MNNVTDSTAEGLEINYIVLDKHELIAELKRKQLEYKKDFGNAFLNELEIILEKCFCTDKKKKEHFITKEKLSLEFLKLLQKQKRFKTCDDHAKGLLGLGAFDKESFLIGKLVSIDPNSKTANFLSIMDYRLNKAPTVKSFDEIQFFDYNSIQFEVFYQKQKQKNDSFNYLETYSFLNMKNQIIKKEKEHLPYNTTSGGVKLDRKLDLDSDVRD